MKTEVVRKNNIEVAVVSSEELLMKDVASALDFAMSVRYETGCTNIAINKEAVIDSFFVLSTCLAGEILQKFINYGVRLAVPRMWEFRLKCSLCATRRWQYRCSGA